MPNTVVQFDHVGKLYTLGVVGTQSITHDVNRWWITKVLRKEDPYLKIGEVNDRSKRGTSNHVWALRDITFEVEQGDVIGIIGKNGAGKSTLLKLLSRVTTPTVGTIRAKGRIASLLEVGTGFHPDMTGRENIYMNGSIMGMRKQEITRKLDEIVDFAGVERYLDTPVKRYSSGMSVRLGFAVAAFLEPDIMVVDEVLAVGDAEFQKKAVGKMQDVAQGEGRTVLFVSHNMSAVSSLCKKGILIENGSIVSIGGIDDVIETYISNQFAEESLIKDHISFLRPWMRIDSIRINGSESSKVVLQPNAQYMEVEIQGYTNNEMILNLFVRFKTKTNTPLATYFPNMVDGMSTTFGAGPFHICEKIALPKTLASGVYNLDILLEQYGIKTDMRAYDCAEVTALGSQPNFGHPLRLKEYGMISLNRYKEQ
jgi:lipopolysaccharide transport system ATP-binding protein